MNEGEIIENCQKSVGILPDEDILANHPWIDDPVEAMERMRKQKEEAQAAALSQYEPFNQSEQDNGEDDVNEK